LDPVGDDQMGVQQRVAFPGCPVVEADRQEPLAMDTLMSAVAAARPDVGVQVGDRLGHAGMVGRQDCSASG
jgi:hypothetical protein